jgi:predicted esterase
MTMETFVHRWEPAANGNGTVALLLHGTGGNENDLVPVGQLVAPRSAILSPRGRVLEHGMPRFFRRVADGVFDLDDLAARTHDLADWLAACAAHYGFDATHVRAAGFSNGANIATSLLFLRPEALAGAVLLRPMLPYEPRGLPDLTGKHVLVAYGQQDPIAGPAHGEKLASTLRRAGASVSVHVSPGGHGLEQGDLEAAARWWADRGA